MPNRDKTGPEGKGPMTGRKLGLCTDGPAGSAGRGLGRGQGQGQGRGRNTGRGLGRQKDA